MDFLLKIKKHQYYLYISLFLIILFFAGNQLITSKVTLVTKNLVESIIQRDLKSKQSIFQFEFGKLNSFILDSKNSIENYKNTDTNVLKEKLLFNCELEISKEHIDNSFVIFINKNKIINTSFLGNNSKKYIQTVTEQIKYLNDKYVFDTILKYETNTYNRKIISYKLPNNTTVIKGYDINLIKFWKYFSENYSSEGSYSVLTNDKGVCLLHPEPVHIGTKIDHFFDKISTKEILQHKNNKNNHIDNKKPLNSKVISEYLKIDVLRYFDVLEIGNAQMILATSFPVDYFLKGVIKDVKQYFLWIILLALLTFMLLLGISRVQLQKEFSRNLKYEKEKKKLAISNEKYQKKNEALQLNQLRKKMNPHFLFNSLNSLFALIDINSELSKKFVLKLADVYRYLLEERKGNLITVNEELHFLEQYFFLHKIRFKDSLHLKITNGCDSKSLAKKIPFLALETLVENAIKHNEITKQKPLYIEILIESNQITVSNNYNPRKNEKKNSHHIGLNYLRNCYQFYNINSFKVEKNDKYFKCYLPLLP